jgi:Cft2 family RNA processing exonuclease
MQFTALTRDIEIGANCYLLQIAGRNLVIDCGAHPRDEDESSMPLLDLLKGIRIDAILLTHAHMDHCGNLPVLQRLHPDAPVFCTLATALLGEVMLHNSVNVMVKKREELGISSYPLFTHKELDRLTPGWIRCATGVPLALDGERATPGEVDLTFTFIDAGHLLGSAGLLIEGEGKRLFFTGDVQFEDQTLCRAAEFPTKNIDILITETTRGTAARAAHYSRAAEAERLAEAIKRVFDRGGAVLMPMFAQGRTQEMMALLHQMMASRRLPKKTPIWIGGLGAKVTKIYDLLGGRAVRHMPDFVLGDNVSFQVLSGRDITDAKPLGGHIYAISSGMMTENTLSNIFARHILSNPVHGLFFVGYADPESPAGRIRATERGSLVALTAASKPQQLLCQVEEFDFSAHAPREALLDYIRAVSAKQTILIHGDRAAVDWFRDELLAGEHPVKTMIPLPGKVIELG